MSNLQNEYPKQVLCPLVDSNIEDIDCIENQDVVKHLVTEKSMPQKYKQKENWREICEQCKYFEID